MHEQDELEQRVRRNKTPLERRSEEFWEISKETYHALERFQDNSTRGTHSKVTSKQAALASLHRLEKAVSDMRGLLEVTPCV